MCLERLPRLHADAPGGREHCPAQPLCCQTAGWAPQAQRHHPALPPPSPAAAWEAGPGPGLLVPALLREAELGSRRLSSEPPASGQEASGGPGQGAGGVEPEARRRGLPLCCPQGCVWGGPESTLSQTSPLIREQRLFCGES